MSDVCGYNFWFDNDLREVSFGYYRSDTAVAIDAYTIDVVQTDDIIDSGISRIVVIGSSSSDSGAKYSASASTGVAPFKTTMYQYNTATSDADCQIIADNLLAELNDAKVRYEITTLVDSDALLLHEGSRITYDGLPYTVEDISYHFNKIVLGVNSRENNFSDVVGGNLTVVNGGGGIESVTTTWDGGEQNIGKTVNAKYNFYIDDIALIGDTVSVNLNLNYAPWKKSLSIGEGGYSTGY